MGMERKRRAGKRLSEEPRGGGLSLHIKELFPIMQPPPQGLSRRDMIRFVFLKLTPVLIQGLRLKGG